MSPRYRRTYNASPLPLRIALITISDLWSALAIGTRWDK